MENSACNGYRSVISPTESGSPKAEKAHRKVFVKVVGLRGLEVPIPEEPTKISCTLRSGIHFITTPEVSLAHDCTVDQVFELIEHSKLEFSLIIRVRRDPHIIAQSKANQPPLNYGGKSRGIGMRSFLMLAPPPDAPVFKPQENLGRYLKPDGSLGRTFLSFKDIAAHLDTPLLEVSFPLIGQKIEVESRFRVKELRLQVGEIVLQFSRFLPST
ncbi:hypothetical protein L226DRAFT_616600 [Lentinus tigrinus ALCF2SS1-7]|uniref:Uncharacterized protein n=1 Tax=Lentinus tigrinus ALCF2SS1-6 TaxID=1328759 RepID=A0A5C2S6G2_9APHY|nr:hypothetical protein L227DRAFT_654584 [Lentinus tigrinus ALCF2SS1-6]RPD69844.1 hypothetical protein L226DRAFT_616600 [Lentinus tigrinus ALCF2SS1-7]